MKVPKGERLFRSLFGDIGTTIFSYDFIYDNLSLPCVQASIEQWIGDWTCNLEVVGSNLPSDKPFSYFFLIISCQLFLKNIFYLQFFDSFCIFTLIMILAVGLIIVLNL